MKATFAGEPRVRAWVVGAARTAGQSSARKLRRTERMAAQQLQAAQGVARLLPEQGLQVRVLKAEHRRASGAVNRQAGDETNSRQAADAARNVALVFPALPRRRELGLKAFSLRPKELRWRCQALMVHPAYGFLLPTPQVFPADRPQVPGVVCADCAPIRAPIRAQIHALGPALHPCSNSGLRVHDGHSIPPRACHHARKARGWAPLNPATEQRHLRRPSSSVSCR